MALPYIDTITASVPFEVVTSGGTASTGPIRVILIETSGAHPAPACPPPLPKLVELRIFKPRGNRKERRKQRALARRSSG